MKEVVLKSVVSLRCYEVKSRNFLITNISFQWFVGLRYAVPAMTRNNKNGLYFIKTTQETLLALFFDFNHKNISTFALWIIQPYQKFPFFIQ